MKDCELTCTVHFGNVDRRIFTLQGSELLLIKSIATPNTSFCLLLYLAQKIAAMSKYIDPVILGYIIHYVDRSLMVDVIA